MSLTDSQTGLLDRPGFVRYADMAIPDIQRSGQRAAVILVDTAPKSMPQTGPVPISAKMLAVLVDLIRDCFRPGDVIARWSDAAFVALLAGEDMHADTLRASISLRMVAAASSISALADQDIAVGVGSTSSVERPDLDTLVRLAFADVAEDRRRRLGWP